MNNLPATFYSLPSGLRRRAICQLEADSIAALADGTRQEVECPVLHSFPTPDLYHRSCYLPAGSVIVGKLHRHGHWNWLTKGHVTVFTEDGGVEDLVAPCRLWSPPATKRAIVVHSDTIWTVEHPSHGLGPDDLDKLEELAIAPSYTALGMDDPMPLALARSTSRAAKLQKE